MSILWRTALGAFLFDQATKYFIFFGLGLEQRGQIDVLPPLLVLKRGYNTGINFGLFSDAGYSAKWILIGIALVICIGLVAWARRGLSTRLEFACAGLIVGGALGNALDRVFHPGVLDFLNMSCCGIQNPYIFNFADVFIFVGAFGLLLFADSGKRVKKGS